MNRLQKKCVIASAGMHLLLVIILFVGPAFISSRNKTDDLPILDFIPLKTTDAMMSGGGRPDGRLPSPPPPSPKAPEPAPPSPQRATETAKTAEPEPAEPEPSFDPARQQKQKKFELKPVKRSAATKNDSHEKQASADAKARKEWADARRRAADALGHAANEIADSVSSGTSIELKGPGGGGVPYANFLQAVKSRYANAWVVPDGITDDDATVAVSVTIARNGDVVSARIVRASGNPAVDRSVQVTLDRVRWAAPLPDDAKEDQRTVSINFNVRAKRGLG